MSLNFIDYCFISQYLSLIFEKVLTYPKKMSILGKIIVCTGKSSGF